MCFSQSRIMSLRTELDFTGVRWLQIYCAYGAQVWINVIGQNVVFYLRLAMPARMTKRIAKTSGGTAGVARREPGRTSGIPAADRVQAGRDFHLFLIFPSCAGHFRGVQSIEWDSEHGLGPASRIWWRNL